VKKATLAILTFIYLLVSSGITLKVHYCMDKRAGVDFYGSQQDERCSKCGMKEKKSGCCSNEHHFYKLSNDHQLVKNLLSLEAPAADLALPTWATETVSVPEACNLNVTNNHSPPIMASQKRHVLFCVFRI
jgi:hypothetical protein